MSAQDHEHSVGFLAANFSSDESPGSDYDLAHDFANDEALAIYIGCHDMAKEARGHLATIATGLRVRMQTMEEGEQ